MSVANEEVVFRVLDNFVNMLEEWRETIIKAAEVFGVPKHEVRKVIERIEEMEEEALHYQIFGFL